LKQSNFQHVFSGHKVKLQKWICSNSSCKWQSTPSFYDKFKTNLSPELIKIHAELGSQNTYRKSKEMLALMMGERRINNKSRIHRNTNIVGEHIETYILNTVADEKKLPEPAEIIILNVDGVHIHDDENRGHNFEAMVAKAYKPENLKHIGKNNRPVITKKHCAGSAKKDKQKTMKERVIEACKLEGMTEKTTIIALSDGAKNCWNIISAVMSLCCCVCCILDWFHIAKYITVVKAQLPEIHADMIEIAKTELWFGRANNAINTLDILKATLTSKNEISKIENFSKYIKDNKSNIVNYNDRQEKGLVFTSNVAESTVEHYASARFKKKQKMQWKRANAHGVLQIRASIISGDWNDFWGKSANDIFIKHVV